MSLLGRPQELQDQIWTYVLGDSMIHVKTATAPDKNPTSKIKRNLCPTRCDLGYALQHAMCTFSPGNTGTPWSKLKNGRSRIMLAHTFWDVMEMPRVFPDYDDPFEEMRCIALLLTCKAILVSALQILYTSNVFYFDESNAKSEEDFVVPGFCATLNSANSASLRKLHLRTALRITISKRNYNLHCLWADKRLSWVFDNANPSGVKRLKGLQQLSMEFVCLLDGGPEQIAERYNMHQEIKDAFSGVKHLGLRELHVTCWNGDVVDGIFRVMPWPMNKKYWDMDGQTGLERRVRARLLGTSGGPLRTKDELELLRFEEKQRLEDPDMAWIVLEKESSFAVRLSG